MSLSFFNWVQFHFSSTLVSIAINNMKLHVCVVLHCNFSWHFFLVYLLAERGIVIAMSVNMITQLIHIRSSPNLVELLIWQYGQSLMTSWWCHYKCHGSLFTGKNGQLLAYKCHTWWHGVSDNWQTPFDDVMMMSSLTSQFIDYWRNLGKFMFTGIFDPFRVETTKENHLSSS